MLFSGGFYGFVIFMMRSHGLHSLDFDHYSVSEWQIEFTARTSSSHGVNYVTMTSIPLVISLGLVILGILFLGMGSTRKQRQQVPE